MAGAPSDPFARSLSHLLPSAKKHGRPRRDGEQRDTELSSSEEDLNHISDFDDDDDANAPVGKENEEEEEHRDRDEMPHYQEQTYGVVHVQREKQEREPARAPQGARPQRTSARRSLLHVLEAEKTGDHEVSNQPHQPPTRASGVTASGTVFGRRGLFPPPPTTTNAAAEMVPQTVFSTPSRISGKDISSGRHRATEEKTNKRANLHTDDNDNDNDENENEEVRLQRSSSVHKRGLDAVLHAMAEEDEQTEAEVLEPHPEPGLRGSHGVRYSTSSGELRQSVSSLIPGRLSHRRLRLEALERHSRPAYRLGKPAHPLDVPRHARGSGDAGAGGHCSSYQEWREGLRGVLLQSAAVATRLRRLSGGEGGADAVTGGGGRRRDTLIEGGTMTRGSSGSTLTSAQKQRLRQHLDNPTGARVEDYLLRCYAEWRVDVQRWGRPRQTGPPSFCESVQGDGTVTSAVLPAPCMTGPESRISVPIASSSSPPVRPPQIQAVSRSMDGVPSLDGSGLRLCFQIHSVSEGFGLVRLTGTITHVAWNGLARSQRRAIEKLLGYPPRHRTDKEKKSEEERERRMERRRRRKEEGKHPPGNNRVDMEDGGGGTMDKRVDGSVEMQNEEEVSGGEIGRQRLGAAAVPRHADVSAAAATPPMAIHNNTMMTTMTTGRTTLVTLYLPASLNQWISTSLLPSRRLFLGEPFFLFPPLHMIIASYNVTTEEVLREAGETVAAVEVMGPMKKKALLARSLREERARGSGGGGVADVVTIGLTNTAEEQWNEGGDPSPEERTTTTVITATSVYRTPRRPSSCSIPSDPQSERGGGSAILLSPPRSKVGATTHEMTPSVLFVTPEKPHDMPKEGDRDQDSVLRMSGLSYTPTPYRTSVFDPLRDGMGAEGGRGDVALSATAAHAREALPLPPPPPPPTTFPFPLREFEGTAPSERPVSMTITTTAIPPSEGAAMWRSGSAEGRDGVVYLTDFHDSTERGGYGEGDEAGGVRVRIYATDEEAYEERGRVEKDGAIALDTIGAGFHRGPDPGWEIPVDVLEALQTLSL